MSGTIRFNPDRDATATRAGVRASKMRAKNKRKHRQVVRGEHIQNNLQTSIDTRTTKA